MPRFKVTAGASCWSASRLDDARRGALSAFACGELGDCLARQTPPSNLIRVGAGAEPLRSPVATLGARVVGVEWWRGYRGRTA